MVTFYFASYFEHCLTDWEAEFPVAHYATESGIIRVINALEVCNSVCMVIFIIIVGYYVYK